MSEFLIKLVFVPFQPCCDLFFSFMLRTTVTMGPIHFGGAYFVCVSRDVIQLMFEVDIGEDKIVNSKFA